MTFLSPSEILGGFLILLCPLGLIGAALLLIFGSRAEERRKKARLYASGGVLMCWPVFVAGLYLYTTIAGELKTQRTIAGYDRLQETLGAPRTVQGVTLPAGAQVVWASDTHEEINAADLPRPSPMFGGVFTGRIDHSDNYWSGTLVSPATLAGWPCAAGPVRLAGDLELVNCVVSRDFRWFGRMVPEGTRLDLDWPTGNHRRLEMPAGRGMDLSRELPDTGLAVPVGGTLLVHRDGSLMALFGQNFQVRGVEFAGGVTLSYPSDGTGRQADDEEGRVYPAPTGVHGWLKSGLVCEGKMIAPDQDSTVDVPWVGEEITTAREELVTHIPCELPKLKGRGVH